VARYESCGRFAAWLTLSCCAVPLEPIAWEAETRHTLLDKAETVGDSYSGAARRRK
jgi:hypothetical protein